MNLDSHEFEILAKDVVQRNLGRNLRTFAEGPDGGIDFRSYQDNEIVGQVKHYIKSNNTSLINSLKKDAKRLSDLDIKECVVVTSKELTPKMEEEIYNMFKDYGLSKEHIFDAIRLNELLEKSEYIDIVRSHYKLWLTSTNILDIVFNKSTSFDTGMFLKDIKKKHNFFVETSTYNKALMHLNDNNLILLEGAPGVGKTTLTQMLTIYYHDQGYQPLYVSNGSVNDIKQALFDETCQVIVLDDFLGHHYMNYKQEIINELKPVINYVSSNKNKKLILNTRITVLNEAIRNNPDLEVFLEDINLIRHRIDVNELSYLEKAKIYYNHLNNNNIPVEYLKTIMKENRYQKIIKHPNYNPRIIEYTTGDSNLKGNMIFDYYEFTIEKLNNPKDIWKLEVDKLGTSDRILINILYTLQHRKYVDYEVLKNCCNTRLKTEAYDTTINEFDASIQRLAGSLINITDHAGKFVNILNPSISDYLYHELQNNLNEVDKLIDNHQYFEQLILLLNFNESKVKKIIINKIINNEFFEMKTYTTSIGYQYLNFISEFEICEPSLQINIFKKLMDSKTYDEDFNGNSALIEKVFFNKKIYQYYELEILLKNEDYVRYLYDKGDIHFLKKFVVLHAEFLGRNEELNLDEEDTEFYRFQVKWALELEIIKRLRLSLTSIIKNQIISNLPTGDICADSDIEDLYESIKLNTKKELMEFIARTVDVYTAKSNNIFLRELKVDQKIIFEELSFNDEFNSEFYHYDFVDYSEESTILLNRENYYNEDKLIDKIFSVFQKNEI